METLFSLSGLVVAPFWALMIFAPGWRWTIAIVSSPWIVAPNLLLYAVLVLPRAGALLPAFGSAAGIAAVLGTPEGAVIAWAHFLAFDLFVGRWIVLDARGRGVPAWAVSPVLALTVLFGPCGLLAYLAVRAAARTPTRSHAQPVGA